MFNEVNVTIEKNGENSIRRIHRRPFKTTQ